MKREILFRGKTNSRKWIYGSLVYSENIQPAIYFEIGKGQVKSFDWFYIEADTVGQFIGVKGYEGDYENRHKNEVKLFEGDIVEAMSEGSKRTFVIKFRNESQPTFILFPAWQGGKMWSIAASDIGREKGDYYDDLKRIGNIYDNPELLLS